MALQRRAMSRHVATRSRSKTIGACSCETRCPSMAAVAVASCGGVIVRGSFVSFDCEEINLGDLKLAEAELLPFLQSFSSGEFTRVKKLNLVGVALLAQRCSPSRVRCRGEMILETGERSCWERG